MAPSMLAVVATALVGIASAQPGSFICPTYVRAVHSFNPAAGNMPALDVYLNGQLVTPNLAFRQVSSYTSVKAGPVTAAIRTAGAAASSPALANVTFIATSNQAYTIGFTGPLAGPAGQVVTSTPPIVNADARALPNPARFAGLWYRWSETALVIDFRLVAGNPAAPYAVGNASDLERISTLNAKTVIPYGEIPSGQVVSFYPTTVGGVAPLWNAPRNEYVTVAGITPAAREWIDVFALGDTLGASHVNNLALTFTRNTGTFDASTGCTLITGAGGAATPASSSASSVGISAIAAVLVLLAGVASTA